MQWLATKAVAMGPTHDTAALRKVLMGPMLAEWTKHVQTAKRRGRVWQYGVDAVRVERVVRPSSVLLSFPPALVSLIVKHGT